MNIPESIALVGEFHRTFKVRQPPLGHGVLLRNKLLWEEYKELQDAKEEVEELDAITDMYYIACGTIEQYDPLQDTTPFNLEGLDLGKCMQKIEAATTEHDWLLYTMTLINLLVKYAEEKRFDLNGAFNEVHSSNMSKLDDKGEPIFRPDGKVLKGPNYRPPRLEKFTRKETND